MLPWVSLILEAKKSRWLAEADPLASEHLVAQSEALLKRTAGRKRKVSSRLLKVPITTCPFERAMYEEISDERRASNKEEYRRRM